MPGFVDAHTHLFNDVAAYGTDLDGIQQLALEQGITSLGNMYTTPDFLSETQVLLTMIGGRVEFCASGNEDVCPDE